MIDALRRIAFAGMLMSIVGLLVFNYGFQMVRVPPSGFGIPLAEIFGVACLPFMFSPAVLRDLRRSKVLHALVFWLIVGITRIAYDATNHGMVAVRDGLSVLEASFFFVGFALSSRAWFVRWVQRLAPYFVAIVIVHGIGSTLAPIIAPYSPHLPSTQGMMIPVFFKYTNTAQVLIVLAIAVSAVGSESTLVRFLPGTLIVMALVLFPSRTALLQVVGGTVAFLVFAPKSRRPKRGPVIATFLLGIIGTVAVANSGVGVTGRLGAMKAGDYVQLLAEMRPTEGPNRHDSLSSGTGQRLAWWGNIVDRVFEKPDTAMLGLGFGIPLIDFRVTSLVVAREPHNTLIGVLGRVGVPGLLVYLYMTFHLALCTIRQVRARMETPLVGIVVFAAALILCTLISGIGESPFTVPAFTVPYFFLAGFIARLDVPARRPAPAPADQSFDASRPVLAAAPLQRSRP